MKWKPLIKITSPTRLKILRCLMAYGAQTTTQLSKRLSMSEGALSHQMESLKSSGVVEIDHKEHRYVYFRIGRHCFTQVSDVLQAMDALGEAINVERTTS